MVGPGGVLPARPANMWSTLEPCIPDDVDDVNVEKAHGKVTLPLSVFWSGTSPVYDLNEVGRRARVYEQVLREGTDDDVRRFIDVDELVALWDRLVLPPAVRRAWARWLGEHRGVTLEC